jgi:phosphatidylinositol alpha 1,6-mannosyltransferase
VTPEVTTPHAGGPLEVVADGSTGLVVVPDAGDIARALGWLREHRDEAASYGRAGNAIAREVTWDRSIERLLG